MLRKLAFGIFLLLTALSIIFAFRSDRDVTTNSSEAYKHYQAGVDLAEKLYMRQAAAEYEQAVALDSGFAVAEAQLAKTYYGLGFKQKSKELWDLAIANKPKVSEREQLLLEMWKSEDGEGFNRVLADSLAELYMAKYPDHREGYVTLCNSEFGRENWERCIELDQKALNIDPNYANAYNMLGYLNYYLGRYDEALSLLEKYIQLCPNQANPHDSRGEILLALGKYDDALAEFREAFNINPDLDFPVLHMAGTYAALGQIKQVDYCFHILAGQASSEVLKNSYLAQQARLYAECKKYDDAIRLSDEVIRQDTDPDKTNAQFGAAVKGYIAYVRRDPEALNNAWSERRRFLKELMDRRPGLVQKSSEARANAYMDATSADLAGDLSTASRLFAECVDSTKSPTDLIGMRTLYADVLWRMGSVDQARSELQKNLSINPNHPRTLIILAKIDDSLGNKDAALALRQQVLGVWKNADSDFPPLVELQRSVTSPLASSSKSVAVK